MKTKINEMLNYGKMSNLYSAPSDNYAFNVMPVTQTLL